MDQIQKNQTKTKAYSVFSLVVLIVIALLFLFPFYWIITGSFKVQPNKIPPEWFPASWTVMHGRSSSGSLPGRGSSTRCSCQ